MPQGVTTGERGTPDSGRLTMKLSSRVRYSVRALIELASAYPDDMLSVGDVAKAQCISAKYLEQLLRALKQAGLVESARGTQGGYSLARPPDSVTLRDVYRAVEKDDINPVHCVADPTRCPLADICPTRDTWVEIRDSIVRVLDQTTIQDLVERGNRKRSLHRPMYYI